MPTLVTVALALIVGAYALLAGAAALGFLLTRRSPRPPAPSEWPPVTVLVPDGENTERLRDALRACDYPADRLNIVSASQHGRDAVPPQSDDPRSVALTLPAGAEVPPGWIQSMVRHARSDESAVTGPTVVEHDDLFLPRLEALQHLARLGWVGGLSHADLPSGPGTASRSVTSDADASADFVPTPDALVERPPVASFGALVQRQAEWFRRAIQSPALLVQGQAAGLWILHTLLLVCAAGAVVLPAWRQPTLLALLGKMGADVLLILPAATTYGQRDLLRSIVPTALMMVVSIPFAGLWGLTDLSREPSPPAAP